ncbi:MAG: hypothetical protein CM1200mP40_18270 [Gammaproteobacteria bacterium]|nr:MAG: hypothetical protein CM1200mP40_18270 [Gammaproteobacteria bacterium]
MVVGKFATTNDVAANGGIPSWSALRAAIKTLMFSLSSSPSARAKLTSMIGPLVAS